jgi:putative FmdB family regulatory protein
VPIYDFKCEHCGIFDSIEKTDTDIAKCPKCGKTSKRIFPTKSPRFNLTYNPKTDICDWQGNTTQYYRLYNEAKERGENVELPEN